MCDRVGGGPDYMAISMGIRILCVCVYIYIHRKFPQTPNDIEI